jgi:RNA polymerase sigma-70 factor (ECF subfamily)
MKLDSQRAQQRLAALLPGEQARLLRLCTAITGDPVAAEDLVQQTFIEAWLQAHKIYDWQGYQFWLSAIARHICQRWLRQQGRESYLSPLASVSDEPIIGEYDLEVELERSELVELLDRALALLPTDVRDVLLERYVAESSYAETAANLGISEALVGVRLHRGKLALQRLLISDFGEEAAVYGLVDPNDDGWRETRIWCPFCGQRKLIIYLDRNSGDCMYRCPACKGGHEMQICHTNVSELIGRVNSPKAILSRQIVMLNQHYRQALSDGDSAIYCPVCDQTAQIHLELDESYLSHFEHRRGVYIVCPYCGLNSIAHLQHLVLDLPITQRFWRAYPRMHLLPTREVEVDGRPALLTTYASITHAAQLDVISAVATLDVLVTHITGDNNLASENRP